MKNLRNRALTSFKNHKLESITIGLVTGLLLAVITAIGLLDITLLFIAVPFLMLPVLFSGFFNHYSLAMEDQINFKNTFRYFTVFFRRPFNSSFRGINSFLKALLGGAAILFTASFIVSTIMLYTNPEFVELMTEFETLISSGNYLDYAILEDLLLKEEEVVNSVMSFTFLPAFGFGFLVFMFSITYNSLSIYLKIRNQTNHPRMYDLLISTANKATNKAIFKEFFALNWPLFLLGFIGYVGGSLGMYFTYSFYFDQLAVFGMIGGLLMMSFHLPFFFNNMETIYDHHQGDFKNASDEINRNMLMQLQSSLKMSQEEQENLQKALDKLNEQLNQEQNTKKETDIIEDENPENWHKKT